MQHIRHHALYHVTMWILGTNTNPGCCLHFDFDFWSMQIGIRYIYTFTIILQSSPGQRNYFQKHWGNDILIIGAEYMFNFSLSSIFQCHAAHVQGVCFNACFVINSPTTIVCYLFCVFDIYVFSTVCSSFEFLCLPLLIFFILSN